MRLLLPLLGLLLALPAAALELMPTTLQLPAEGGHAELWLHNPGPSRWQGQVHILAWEQHPDAEVLRPSDQILASPTQLDLAPRGTPTHLAAATSARAKCWRAGLPDRAGSRCT